MLSEAGEAGTYEYDGVHHPRIQFLTADDKNFLKCDLHHIGLETVMPS